MADKLILDQITLDIEQAVSGLLEAANLTAGDILVIGCSSSEVQKQRIGSAVLSTFKSSPSHRSSGGNGYMGYIL